MGIGFALIALLSWGVGDFLIQRSARKFGDWEALFFITLSGFVLLTPFVIDDLKTIFITGLPMHTTLLFIGLAFITLFAALLDFEALKQGKISIVEPIYTMEILVTTMLSAVILKEFLTPIQYGLVGVLILGIFLITIESFDHLKGLSFERGIRLAIFATLAMGVVNFLFGVNSRISDPLLINWFVNLVISVITIMYIYKNFHKDILKDIKRNKKLVFWVCILDNAAWVAYAISTTYIPIAIATGLSESYIVIGVVLGIIFNQEKLVKHQYLGLFLTIVSGVALAITTGG
jgi:drug/metabolite transporter (DMT)-like permease